MTSARFKAIWQINKFWPVLLLVLFTGSIALFVVNQQLISPGVAALERDYIDLQQRSKQARQLKAAADNPMSVYQRGKADLDRFMAMIPAQQQFTALVAELFKMSEAAGLEISSVNYQPKELKDQQLLQYGLSFSVTGQYAQLKKFIAQIETSNRIVAIESIALRGKPEDDRGVSLQLQLVTFFKADQS